MTNIAFFSSKEKMRSVRLKTFIDLFAGIGGFRIALESLGLDCVFSSEWDKYAQKTYYENFGENPAGDITKIDEKDIPSHDILCAGFPCQAFSISGKQKGFEDTRGTLFFDIARIAKYHRPKVLFLENVKNFERHNDGNTLKTVLRVLDELGYFTFYKILNASLYGVPTSRERIYFVCFRKDLGVPNFSFPEPTLDKIYLKDILERNIDFSEYEIRRKDIKLTKKGEQRPSLRPLQIGTMNNGGQGERIYSIQGHAITLSAYGGGAAAKTGAYLIDGKVRKLTPRECARLMGFPDDFKIPASRSQAYKQFGNSVAVPVLMKITKQILKACKVEINEIKRFG
jgi:DNA (cytosine-5)-methyltransferase 1